MNIWQIAWRNLMRRKLRTLLTLLSIVIGVASTFAVTASVDTAKRTFPLYLKAAFGKADYLISGTEAYMPEEVLQDAEKLNDTAAIAVLKQNTKLHLEQEGISGIQKRVELSGYSKMDTPLTNFKVVEGSLTGSGAVITDRTAKAWNAQVGDTISFDTSQGTKSIQVSAIIKYTVELMGPSGWMMAKYHHWAVAVPLSVLQDWFGLDGKIQTVHIKALHDSSRGEMERQANELIKRNGNMYMQPVLVDFGSVSQSGTFFMALYLAGFLGIVLSGFIIFNTLYVSVKERKQEFAVLKTIGYLPEQLRAVVLREVFLLSIAGTVIGLLFGYGFANLLTNLIYKVFSIYEESSGMVLIQGLAVAVLAGLLVPFAAALVPIRQVGKTSVIEVLKENRTKTSSRKWWLVIFGVLLIVSSFFIKHLLLIVPLLLGIALVYPTLFTWFIFLLRPVYRVLFGFSGQIAASNLRRNLARTSMTSVILCWGIAMVVMMSSINSSFVQSYEKIVYSSYGGNLDIHFHHTEKTDVEQLKQIQGVADAKPYGLYSAIWSLNGQQRKLPVFGVGEWVDRFPLFVSDTSRSDLIHRLNEDEIILDKAAYESWGGKLGDSVELATLKGNRMFKVVAIVSTMKNGGYGAFMKEEAFKENFGLKYDKNVLVVKDQSTSPLQLRENIFGRFGERTETMFGPEDIVSMVGSMYTGSFSVVNGLIILSIIISAIGITNTLLINIMERIRELGMMRAVGVTRKQVIGMVNLEGFGIGIAATVIGCLFGIALIYLTSTFLEINSLAYQFGVSWIIIAAIGLFGIAISLIASFTPASRAAKTRLSEALRYE